MGRVGQAEGLPCAACILPCPGYSALFPSAIFLPQGSLPWVCSSVFFFHTFPSFLAFLSLYLSSNPLCQFPFFRLGLPQISFHCAPFLSGCWCPSGAITVSFAMTESFCPLVLVSAAVLCLFFCHRFCHL